MKVGPHALKESMLTIRPHSPLVSAVPTSLHFFSFSEPPPLVRICWTAVSSYTISTSHLIALSVPMFIRHLLVMLPSLTIWGGGDGPIKTRTWDLWQGRWTCELLDYWVTHWCKVLCFITVVMNTIALCVHSRWGSYIYFHMIRTSQPMSLGCSIMAIQGQCRTWLRA